MEEISKYAVVNRLVGTISSVVISATGVFTALSVLDLSGVVATLLASIGIIGLALSFAFRGIAMNLIASVAVSVRLHSR